MEFSDQVEIKALPEPDPDSDLTDLAELEESIALGVPSPRRLRSKGERPKVSSQSSVESEVDASRRVTPMRKAKRNIGSLKESDDDKEEDELIESDADDHADEIQESHSPTPKANRVRRTPLRRRLRSRRPRLEEPPSDGDDEGSEGELSELESLGDEDAEGEEVEEEDEDEDDGEETVREESDTEEAVEEDDDFTIVPITLRNGKVVGEEDAEGEDDEEVEEVDEEGQPMQDDASIDLEAASDEDADADESMEDDGAYFACRLCMLILKIGRL